MVTIFNKSNRPIGVANQSVLPDKEIKVKDKFVYCEVFDENGAPTGEKMLLPGLVVLVNMGFVTVKEEKEEVAKPVEKEPVEEKPKTKKTRKAKEE